MRCRKVEPNLFVFNAAISAMKQNWEQAVDLLYQIEKCGLVPDVYSYSMFFLDTGP